MARPSLHVAVAGTKNTATNYNENFDLMMTYCEEEAQSAKDYVDSYMPTMTGQSGKFLTTDGTDASWVSLTGTIIYYGYSSAPTGWLICDGSAISRTTYSALFSAIGTTFGSGDGSTTFNLPDLIDRFPQGNTTVGTEKDAGLPNIEGAITCVSRRGDNIAATGAFQTEADSSGNGGVNAGSNIVGSNVYFDASRSNSIYGNSTIVQPPALTLLPIIKY